MSLTDLLLPAEVHDKICLAISEKAFFSFRQFVLLFVLQILPN